MRLSHILISCGTLGLLGCAEMAGSSANFTPSFINSYNSGPGNGRMSNTAAVQSCESQGSPRSCNDLRLSELDKIISYLESTYPESFEREAALSYLRIERLSVQAADMQGLAFEPTGGRPFTSIGNVPMPGVTPQSQADNMQALQTIADVATLAASVAVINQGGVPVAGPMAGMSLPQNTTNYGQSCLPKEVTCAPGSPSCNLPICEELYGGWQAP